MISGFTTLYENLSIKEYRPYNGISFKHIKKEALPQCILQLKSKLPRILVKDPLLKQVYTESGDAIIIRRTYQVEGPSTVIRMVS